MSKPAPGQTLTFQCGPDLREALDSMAKSQGRSTGNLVRHYLWKALNLTDEDASPDTEPTTPELPGLTS